MINAIYVAPCIVSGCMICYTVFDYGGCRGVETVSSVRGRGLQYVVCKGVSEMGGGGGVVMG